MAELLRVPFIGVSRGAAHDERERALRDVSRLHLLPGLTAAVCAIKQQACDLAGNVASDGALRAERKRNATADVESRGQRPPLDEGGLVIRRRPGDQTDSELKAKCGPTGRSVRFTSVGAMNAMQVDQRQRPSGTHT